MRRVHALLLAALASFSGCSTPAGVLLDNARMEMGAGGGWAMQRFELVGPSTVSYDTETRNDDSYDVCIITSSEEQFWKDGNAVRGYACNGEVSRAADSAALAAGEYALALRCRNIIENCVVAVTLSVA